MISAASGKKEKILEPLSHFCDFDMILELPGIFIIRTLTHTRLLKINYNSVKNAFGQYGLRNSLIKMGSEFKSSLVSLNQIIQLHL